MTVKAPKTTKKRGRLTKEAELSKLIATVGVDPDSVDPRRVLAGISVDPQSPATARVAAAKALLILGGAAPTKAKPEPEKTPADDAGADVVDITTRRALQIMKRRQI